MTFRDQELLRGWHAAEAGTLFDFQETPDWQEGHMTWTQHHPIQAMCFAVPSLVSIAWPERPR